MDWEAHLLRQTLGDHNIEYRKVANATQQPALMMEAYQTPLQQVEARVLVRALMRRLRGVTSLDVRFARTNNNPGAYYQEWHGRGAYLLLPPQPSHGEKTHARRDGLNVQVVLHEVAHHVHYCLDENVRKAHTTTQRRRYWHGSEFTQTMDALALVWKELNA